MPNPPAAGMRRELLALLGAALLGVALCWLALQLPARLAVDVGGGLRAVGGRIEAPAYDLPYLRDVYAPEPATLTISTTETYRWTRPQAAVAVPAIGGAALATLRVLPPPAPSVPLTLTANGRLATVALPPGPRIVAVLAPAAGDGAAHIGLEVPAYLPPGDPRELGLALDWARVRSLGGRPFAPWALLGQLGGVLALIAAGAALSGLELRVARWTVLLAGAGLALWLALARFSLALFGGPLLLSAGLACGLLLAGRLALLAPAPGGIPRAEWLPVLGLAALGFGLRLAGMRHPQANFSDLMLHVNNWDGAARGGFFFTEGLTCEAGAGRSPYPPGVYAALLPLLAFGGDHALLLQVGAALLDALVIPLLWWLARDRSPQHGRAALAAAALYVLPPPILKSLTIGELAQVGGLALAMPGVAALIAWARRGMPWRWLPGVVAALALGGLVHSGVLISFGLWGVAWCGLLLLRRSWREAGRLALAGALGAGLAAALYFSAYLGDPTLAGAVPGCPTLTPLAGKLANLVRGLLRPDAPLPIWLLALGVAGWLASRRSHPALALPLAAWLLAALLSQVSLLWSEQTVRWIHFLYPGVCVGAGLALAALAGRGRTGRGAAAGVVAGAMLLALAWWIVQIAAYRTGNFI